MNTKRIISLALSLVIAAGAAIPVIRGDNSTTSYLTASAEGYDGFVLEETEDDCVAITGYNGTEENIVIPSAINGKQVRYIDFDAFRNNKYITDVTIYAGVEDIRNCAFMNCTNLKSVKISGSVRTICGAAFYGCTSLEEVVISNGVTEIHDSVFCSCPSLKNVTIPSSVEMIMPLAFGYYYEAAEGDGEYVKNPGFTINGYKDSAAEEYAKENGVNFEEESFKFLFVDEFEDMEITGYLGSDKNVVIPDSICGYPVVSIGYGAFGENKDIVSVTIPDSVQTIGHYAFIDCENLSDVSIPEDLEYVYADAFTNTAWLKAQPDGPLYIGKTLYGYCGEMPENTSLEIKEGTVSVAEYAFYGYDNLISVTIPNSIYDSTLYNTFVDCKNLTKVTIGDEVSDLGWGTFYGCESLTEVNIPSKVTYIGGGLFNNCTSLKEITIPASVKTIEETPFGYCTAANGDVTELTKLEDFTIRGYAGTAAEQYAAENGFEFIYINSGDVDGNGNRDIMDVVVTRSSIVGNAALTEEQAATVDVNGDGNVDIVDVVLLRSMIVNS